VIWFVYSSLTRDGVYSRNTGSVQWRKSGEVQVRMSRPSRKSRWYSRYSPRTASQNARFCESNAPFVITGWSLRSDQWRPSGDWNA
jgi:hypothetical protein